MFELIYSIVTILGVFMIVRYESKKKQQAKFIEDYEFPVVIDERLLANYPDLSLDDIRLVKYGLRQYFLACSSAGFVVLALPSSIVNRAWREFSLSRKYHYFCYHAFGFHINHKPFVGISDSLKCAWLHLCHREHIDVVEPHQLPFLFRIDSMLNIPDGNNYSLEKVKVGKNRKSTSGGDNLIFVSDLQGAVSDDIGIFP